MFELLAVAGFVLGVVGMRRGSRALAEVAALRNLLAERTITLEPEEPAAARNAPLAPVREPMPEPRPELEPEPELEAVASEAAPVAARPPFDLEQALTQRWGVWLGAAALLLAGVFLVRTAVEQGWLGPGPRCALAGLLGAALVAGAEWARRREWAGTVPKPALTGPALAGPALAGPALAAGGVGVLFAAAYGAGPLYGLVSGGAGFVLLAAAGVLGLGLSLRFGRLVAAVGLAASFTTPALVVSTQPSVPGLFGYLLFVSAASWAVVRWTAWVWLGWAAAAGGAAWVLVAVGDAVGGAAVPDLWAVGLFVPAASALTLALLPGAALDNPAGRRFAWAPMLLLGLAGLLLLSATKDEWVRAGVLLLAPLAIVKAWREERVAWLPAVSAGLSVAAVWVWGVGGLQAAPGGPDVVSVEGVTQAVLPRGWTLEEMLWPFIGVPGLVAGVHAAAGLLGERLRGRPLPWAALVAAVPVVVGAVAYAEAGHTLAHGPWAVAAGVLAAGLVGAAALARRAAVLPVQRAGVHAAGAVAALALGFAIVLDDGWLTVALALLLPGLAWIEAAAELPPLQRVALAVASAVLVRLVLNPGVADYHLGTTPVLNGLLVAYGIPAAAFALAARWFRRRGDDALVGVLEAGAIAFGALLYLLEVHHASTGGVLTGDPSGFGEFAWQVGGLWVIAAGLQAAAGRTGRRVQRVAWRVAGVLALLGGIGLLLLSPFVVGGLGPNVVLSALIPAYLVPALAAGWVLRQGARPRWLFGAYAFAALLMFASAQVRQLFHPGMTEVWAAPVEDAELWALSGAWLLLALLLLGAGMALRQRAIRLAGLLAMLLVVGKVFLVDMSGLDGLWRVLSFLGLGLSLIGLGAFYRRFGGSNLGSGSLESRV